MAGRRSMLTLLVSAALPAPAPAQPEGGQAGHDAVEGADPAAWLQARLQPADPQRCFQQIELVLPSHPAPPVPGDGARPPPRRVVMAIDSSGSMAARAGGVRKIDAAREAAMQFLDRLAPDTQAGLLLFGHRGNNRADGRAESCRGVELVLPSGRHDRAAREAALRQLRPVGWTPLATAIETAGRSFEPSDIEGEQVVYVISDGVETCGGDAVTAARGLRQSRVRGIVDIIGFDLPPGERQALRAVAEAGGGRFLEAATAAELRRRTGELAEAARQAGARLRAGGAEAGNRLSAGNAAAGARLCIGNLLAAERLRISNLLATERMRGRMSQEDATEVERLLGERHHKVEGLLAAYLTAVEAANAETVSRIRRELDAALSR